MPFLKYQNLIEIFQSNQGRYLPIIQFIATTMQSESAFSTGEKELIAAYVSALNACNFCIDAHLAIAADLNIEPTLLEAMVVDLESAPLAANLRPIFRFVGKLTLNPSKIAQIDLDSILLAGWTEAAISDAIDICALFSFMNRLVDGYGLQSLESEQLKGLARGINTQGYQDFFLSNNQLL